MYSFDDQVLLFFYFIREIFTKIRWIEVKNLTQPYIEHTLVKIAKNSSEMNINNDQKYIKNSSLYILLSHLIFFLCLLIVVRIINKLIGEKKMFYVYVCFSRDGISTSHFFLMHWIWSKHLKPKEELCFYFKEKTRRLISPSSNLRRAGHVTYISYLWFESVLIYRLVGVSGVRSKKLYLCQSSRSQKFKFVRPRLFTRYTI